MSTWNYGDVWEAVADVLPDAPALTHGQRTLTWGELDRRADNLARWFLHAGTGHQDKVAIYLYNCSEYLEATFGCFKIGLVPINTNYRYADNELVYLWENADAVAVIFHGTFVDRIEGIRDKTAVRSWLWVDDGTAPCPPWAVPYEGVATATVDVGGSGSGDPGRVHSPWGRGPDDIYMLYTGGTTGMPKGVMWRQDDLFSRLNGAGFRRYPDDGDVNDVRAELERSGPGMTLMPACPLMHGTGAFTSIECLSEGGRVVTLPSRHFDPIELLDTVEKERVNGLVIVGDAFAKPILASLDAHPDRWDLSSLMGMVSSGVMWSEEVKEGLLRHHGTMLLVDAFSSSEAIGIGSSVSSGSSAAHTARFTLGPEVRVLDADGHDVEPGSGRSGVLALTGRIPLGYYKDQAKTTATFRTIDGIRYSVPGDYAEVGEDGTIHLLGRGSVCINTGGEKVYPEEVEAVLKSHPAVGDALVIGLPDARWGEVVVGVVEPATGEAWPGIGSIQAHCRSRLAGYKIPRTLFVVPSVERMPSGKADYRWARSVAAGDLPARREPPAIDAESNTMERNGSGA